jgi:hypothetical protein
MALPGRRFTLADHLLIVAFAGLTLAWILFLVKTEGFLNPLQPEDRTTLVTLIAAFLVICFVYGFVKAKRTAPTCTVCGRRFMAPPQPAETAICTKCRRRSLNPPQPKPTGERPRAN